MTLERAAKILDPNHREHYDSIETVNEACRMGMYAIKMRIKKAPIKSLSCYHCGNCKTDLFVAYGFCPACGQALDWSEFVK